MFTLLDWHTASWAILLLGMAEVMSDSFNFFVPCCSYKQTSNVNTWTYMPHELI